MHARAIIESSVRDNESVFTFSWSVPWRYSSVQRVTAMIHQRAGSFTWSVINETGRAVGLQGIYGTLVETVAAIRRRVEWLDPDTGFQPAPDALRIRQLADFDRKISAWPLYQAAARARLVAAIGESYDSVDLAANFVEEEVGRLDWRKNLKKLKELGKLGPRLGRWMGRMGIPRGQRSEIMAELGRLDGNPGRWR